MLIKASRLSYANNVYKGARHAYKRRGDDPKGSVENKAARNKSFKRIIKLLKKL